VAEIFTSMIFQRILNLFLLICLVTFSVPSFSVQAVGKNQESIDAINAQAMLDKMTPEEKVGQLFLVSFTGSSINEQTQIYDLILRYHIGGVELRNENDNFVPAPDTVSSAYQLIDQLQNAEYQASQIQPVPTPEAGTPTPIPVPTPIPANFVPLFIAINQNGGGYPNDQILNGLTPLPDLMALGATWNPSLAEQVGEVAGEELSKIGINFFIGPSLDVLDNPDITLSNELDATVFGGDPYWVSVMGSAYISGLHSGSNGRMMVVADHFPGIGSADRPVSQESATVRKSLELLKQTDLLPFYDVTGNAKTTQAAVDGLLVSHAKYQGFQGNIRSTTRPVSLDPQAISQIMALPEISSWRQAGGLLVSDDLGSQSVRLYYDPGGQSFLARLVALDAFLAGNDVLNMGNIVSTDAKNNYDSITQTLNFFVQKYRADSAFAKRVDDSVLRILTAKYHIYGTFNLNLITPSRTGLESLGQSETVTSDVAREAATLVSPDSSDLETALPTPPNVSDHIVFLTDDRTARQCSTCADNPMMAKDALQNAILRLYGSQAGGQVIAGRLISYSLDSVSAILPDGGGNQELETSLLQAKWVVISMLNAEPDQPQTVIIKRLLSERQDLLREKHVIVFGFDAPFFLDATDISKITAYYCLYSKSAPFVEVAARLLFRELTPTGMLPVSVTGIGYDLHIAITPDPTQLIALSLELPSIPTPTSATLLPVEPTITPSFKVGDTFSVRTGVIVDNNGHPVPDGTKVQFRIAMNGTGGFVQQIAGVTTDGFARASFSIDRPGLLEISASSDPALSSVVLQLNVTNEGSSVTIVTPTPSPQFTPTSTQVPSPTPFTETPSSLEKGYTSITDWLLMVISLFGLAILSYWFGDRIGTPRWGVRWAICVVLGGLLAYTYLATRLPGSSAYLQRGGWSGMMGIVLLGAVVGLGAAYVWYKLSSESAKQSS
jgi:beta-N-acetylhexosaminidase